MKKLNKTKFAILGLLTIQPQSGYDIKKMIEQTLSYFWSESNGQLYPALNELQKSGWVALQELREKGKKERNIYSITDMGQRELNKWLESSEEEKSIHRDETLLKLFFGKNLNKKNCMQRLENRKRKMKGRLKEYNQILQQLQTKTHSPHHVYWLLTLQNGICSAKAEILWCSRSIKTLEGISS